MAVHINNQLKISDSWQPYAQTTTTTSTLYGQDNLSKIHDINVARGRQGSLCL